MVDKRFSIEKRTAGRSKPNEWALLEIEPAPGDPPGLEKRQVASRETPWIFGRFTTLEAFGGAVAVLAVIALVLNLTLPWIYAGVELDEDQGFTLPAGSEPQARDREEAKDWSLFGPQQEYTQRLIDWPLASFIVMMVAGAMLFGTAYFRGVAPQVERLVQIVLLMIISFFGFLTALTGTRFLGDYFSILMSETGQGVYHLHVVPYLNLVVGGAVLSGAVFLLVRAVRLSVGGTFQAKLPTTRRIQVTGLTVGVITAGLLLLPLLPYMANSEGEEDFYLSETSMAFVSEYADMYPEETKDLTAAAKALSGARIVFWVLLYVSLASFLFSVVDATLGGNRATTALVQVHAALLPGLVLAGIFIAIYYARAVAFEDFDLFFNPVLPLLWGALTALAVIYVHRVLLPFWKDMQVVLETHRMQQVAQED